MKDQRPEESERQGASRRSLRPDEPLGIECPDCGCFDLRVYYTRRNARRIVRVRICEHCERKVRTVEKLAG